MNEMHRVIWALVWLPLGLLVAFQGHYLSAVFVAVITSYIFRAGLTFLANG